MKELSVKCHLSHITPSLERKEEFAHLSTNHQHQSTMFKKTTTSAQSVTAQKARASYYVAYISHPPQASLEGEFIKECKVAITENTCPEKELFQNVSLLASMFTCHLDEMVINVHSTVEQCCCDAYCFFIDLDKSMDIKDTAQLAVYFCGVMDNFDVVEEFVFLVALHGTTTGVGILDDVLQWMEEFALDLMQLCSVTTDGPLSMLGKQKGFVALLEKHCHNLGFTQDTRRPFASSLPSM